MTTQEPVLGLDRSRQSSAIGATAVFFAGVCVLAALAISTVFLVGIDRGMDRVLAFGPESDVNSIAVAVTALVYGEQGYVAYYPVFEALMQPLQSGAEGPNDPRILANLRSGDLINEALAKASSLGPVGSLFVSDGGLRTMVYDDLGTVDYAKMAFGIFGFKIESLYYLYFSIVALSTLAFLIQFRAKPVALMLLLCVLGAFFLETKTGVFNDHQPTFWGHRHGSTLALIPMWHLALLLVFRWRLAPSSLLVALLQAAILVLAIKMRGSAVWTVVFLCGLSMLLSYRAWRLLPPATRTFWDLVRPAFKWPLVVSLLCVAANNAYTDAKLHPAYFTDDIIAHHGAWDVAFLGMAHSPTLWHRVGGTYDKPLDRVGVEATLAYLQEHRFLRSEAEFVSPWTGTYKYRMYDDIMKRVFLSHVLANPFSVIELYLYWKPKRIVELCISSLATIDAWSWAIVLLSATAMALALALAGLCKGAAARSRIVPLLALAAPAFAALPNLWAFASPHTLADVVLSLLVALVFSTSWLLCWRMTKVVSAE